MTVSSQSFFAKKCALMAMTMTALTVNANPVDTGLGFAANGNSLAFCSFESNTQMQQDNIYCFLKRRILEKDTKESLNRIGLIALITEKLLEKF